jgi:hypothetical protein
MNRSRVAPLGVPTQVRATSSSFSRAGFKTPVEDNATPSEIRMKLAINTREIDAYDPPKEVEFGVDNPGISLHRSAQ